MKPEFLSYLQAEAEAKKKSGVSFRYTGNLDDLLNWVKRKYKRFKRSKDNGTKP